MDKIEAISRKWTNSMLYRLARKGSVCLAMLGCLWGLWAWEPNTACGAEKKTSPAATATKVASGADFRLRDFLNRTWRNECVVFRLGESGMSHVHAKHALVDSHEAVIPYQTVTRGGSQQLAFLMDLDPFETREFKFSSAQPASEKTDLVVREDEHVIHLENSRIGLRIRKQPQAEEGPFAGIRLNSGRWVTESKWISTNRTDYSTEIIARGPVFAAVICRAKFADGGEWTLRLRLDAREPVAIVDESFSAPDQSKLWGFNLDHDFQPDTLLYREGNIKNNPLVWTLAGDLVWRWQPWLAWWAHGDIQGRGGPCFSLFRQAPAIKSVIPQPTDGAPTPELLTFAAREASAWVDPDVPPEQRMPGGSEAKRYDNVLWLPFHVYGKGTRKWLVGALPADEGLTLAKGEKLPEKTVIQPDQYLIKHSHIPLNRVKDFILTWPGKDESYPKLFVTQKDLPALRRSQKLQELFAPRLDAFKQGVLSEYALDGEITATGAYFLAGDPQIGQTLIRSAPIHIQRAVDNLVKQDTLTFGTAPHVAQALIVPGLGMADAALADPQMGPVERERLQAQIAFLAYMLNSPSYWSPPRGYAANPNMTTTVNWLKLMCAALVSSHPQAKTWAADATGEFRNEVQNWIDDNGGILEAPHYATVLYDQLLAGLLIAQNANFEQLLYDPRMKLAAEWIAKISTPPDARLMGRRHLPPIGNTYLQEANGVFGAVATIWKQQDPQFAAEMKWMYEQQGSLPVGTGLIGSSGLFKGVDVDAKPPAYQSELFPRTGAVLRHNFPSDRESYLYLIAGDNHQHYDDDSGSFVMWGMGRVMASDFGYTGRAPEEDQSMVSTAGTPELMAIDQFHHTEGLDFLRGQKGPWTRQVALVKGRSPDEPTYFVLADSLRAPAPYTWRLWLSARDVVLGNDGDLATPLKSRKETEELDARGLAIDPSFATARQTSRVFMSGREDVDLDLFFFQPINLKTEVKTRESLAGWDETGKQVSQMPYTQIGLISADNGQDCATAILFPRLKVDAPPQVSAIADGRGMKLVSGTVTDYVFASSKPIKFNHDKIRFEGTMGLVRLRDEKPELQLGAPGTISYGDKQLKRDQ